MPEIEIFRAGTHTATNGQTYTYTHDDLKAVVEGYRPKRHHAPLVVGHPKMDAPAYGWVSGLRIKNDRLVADVDQLDSQFADLVRQGRFKKVSASFYLPDSPVNPTPGALYLRHVGFLGAQPPAVKGLQDARFSESINDVIITFEEKYSMTQEELLEQQIKLQAEQAKLREEQTAFAEQQRAVRLSTIQERVKGYVKQGQLLPRLEESVVALLASASPECVEYGEVKKTPEAILFDLLDSLPKQVEYSELSKDGGAVSHHTIHAPSGYTVDEERSQLHAKVCSHMEGKGMDVADAGQYIKVVSEFESGALK